jgi:thiamine pyrophosphokinase
MQHGVVFIGGDPPHPGVLAHLPRDRWVVAADSGLDHAVALGVGVDLVVGDMDSVTPAVLEVAEAAGTAVERHSPDKEATDTELALDAAIARGCTRIVVVGGGGDRLDHALGALLALTRPVAAGVEVDAWWGAAHVLVLRGPATRAVAGTPGALVSLLAVHGAVSGVRTSGLRYPLHGEELHAGSSRGISNVFESTTAHVEVGTGSLVVVVPHALEAPCAT